ncbi:MAG: nucleoside diphosphate kinase regulator [Fibrobacter sp.]|jgi:regulator of nucleoside diphosphate kinase|nr:nucleoside diphosphate kinase regulator [Fibrobacter sp.]
MPADKPIYVTENDMRKLRALVQSSRGSRKINEKSLQILETELNKAKVVRSEEIPSDVITMHSEVQLLDLDSNEETTYRIVYPNQADIDKGFVSILAPIGTALLGYSVGDIIEWSVPAGTAKWKVMKISYQPESAGDYQL